VIPVNVRACILAFLIGVPVGLSAQTGRDLDGRPIRGGAFEASGVVAVPGSSGVLFVDDGRPRHVFWMELDANGVQSGQALPIPLGVPVTDLEDITSDGTWFYAVGSQSKGNTKAGYGLVRFAFDPRTRTISDTTGIADLTGILRRRVPELATGSRGKTGTLNIEGLTWDPASSRLLLGLREPVRGSDALIIAMKLPAGAHGPFDHNALENAELSVLRLPARGLGIRGLGSDSSTKSLLVLLGPAEDTPGRRQDFRLLTWNASGASLPVERASFPFQLKPEGVTRVMSGGRLRTLIVADTSRYLLLD
jgi:hypothetical protein